MITNSLKNLERKVGMPAINLCCSFLMLAVKIRKGRKPFNSEELKLLHRALLSENLCCIGGKMVADLEKEFAQVYEVPYGIASTSGTAAIHVRFEKKNRRS